MQWRSSTEHDDHLRVRLLHVVVADHGRRDVVLCELPQQLQGDVRDDLDVNPRMVVDLEALDRIDVRHVPPRLELRIVVDASDELAEPAVRAPRKPDPHLRDRSRGSEARLAGHLDGGRRLEELGCVLACFHDLTLPLGCA